MVNNKVTQPDWLESRWLVIEIHKVFPSSSRLRKSGHIRLQDIYASKAAISKQSSLDFRVLGQQMKEFLSRQDSPQAEMRVYLGYHLSVMVLESAGLYFIKYSDKVLHNYSKHIYDVNEV